MSNLFPRHEVGGTHDHSSMDMTSGNMDASHMNMVFFSSTTTQLFSSMWAPTTSGQYAATCIFLLVLAILYRGSFTLKNFLEQRWLAKALKRRYIVVADKTPVAERLAQGNGSREAILTTNGVEERVKVVSQPVHQYQPWRFSIDLPRALLVTVMVGVGYLLMLAVMTMNVGYFLSILAGAFVGEVAFGRFLDFSTHH